MYLSNLSRIDLLQFLPNGGEVAEIGVAEGTFSKLILAQAVPQRLHLIDPWEHQTREDYQGDTYGNPNGDEQEKRFKGVSDHFASEIEAGRVIIHRTYSTIAAESFANDQFDWIYLDGLHSLEGISADLAAFSDKVKPDGFILGHDYTNHAPALNSGFGVVEAVNDFVVKEDYHFLVMTMEVFPTYVLTRNPGSAESQALISRLLYFANWVVEVRDYPGQRQYQHNAIQVADKTVVFPTF